jgi:hypothetical protein
MTATTTHATITCAFCGREDVVTGRDRIEAIADHVLACPEHPLARVARHNARLLECLTEVLRWLRAPPGERSAQAMVERTIEAVMRETMEG